MAYNNNTPRAEYTASAAQTVFPFLFKIFTSADIKVYQTPSGQVPDDTADLLTLTTDYTVTINGDAGGEITLVSGASNGDKLTLLRSLEITRNIEYQAQGDLTADTLNLDQEYQTYLIADKEASLDRVIKLPENVQTTSNMLPPPESLQVIRWNSAGTALENHTIGDDSVFINIYNVDNIAAMLLVDPLVIPTVNVRGYYTANDGGGGIFNYNASQSAVNDGGTIINGWVRQYSGAVNVKWFGAKGDGVTDDTVAIQLAIDNANGELEATDGVFINTTVTINSNILLFGSATFKRKLNYDVDDTSAGASNTTMFDITSHGIEVKFDGITFDGNEQNQDGYEPSSTLIRAYDLAGTITSVLKIDVSNCTFKNQTRSSLTFKGSETTTGQELATVTNCWFSEGRKGIGAGDPRAINPSGFAPTYINANDGFKVNVDNCKFTFTQTLSVVEPLDYAPCGIKFTYIEEDINAGGSSGIITNNLFYKLGRSDYSYTGAVDGNNGIGVVDAYSIGRDIIIQGNRFIECYEACVRGKTNIDGLIIDANIFHDCKDAAVAIGPKGTYNGDQIGRIVISNNIVRGADVVGFSIVGESTVVPAYAGDISIIGNMISGITNINTIAGNVGAIVVRFGGRVVISDNNIYSCNAINVAGIMVKETSDVVVNGNKIVNVGYISIFLTGISDRALVDGNDIDQAAATGIYLDSTGTPDVVVSDNIVSNVVTYGINVSQGRYVTVTGNNVTEVTGSSRGFYVGVGVIKAIVSGNVTNAATPTYITIGNNICQELNSWNHTINQRSAAPTVGTWAVGDIIYHTTPIAGGFIGSVCITAGTPGTWKTFGAISV